MNNTRKLITIGTRGSALARVQADWVAARLKEAHPDLDIAIETILTHGDQTQATNVPLSSFGEKGIFAKELETALLSGEIDIAVHSMKDLAATLPDRLGIIATPARQDVRDVVIGAKFADLPSGAKVGTGSVRRVALVKALRPDLVTAEIRGNVDTRIRKLHEGQYDAILLAAAGLNRLGREAEIADYFDPEVFTPDPGQGSLAIEARIADAVVAALLAPLNDLATQVATRAERAYLTALGGGCHTPVGAWATVSGDTITLRALVVADDGAIRRTTLTGPTSAPEALGQQAAAEIG